MRAAADQVNLLRLQRMDERGRGESFERHRQFDRLSMPTAASDRKRFEASAAALREQLATGWLGTKRTSEERQPKRVYYPSLAYLRSCSLKSHLAKLRADGQVREMLARPGIDLERVCAAEPHAGPGDGGLGRRAVWFHDSVARLHRPGIGYGLCFECGIFRQRLSNGRQVEHPHNGLRRADPRGLVRPEQAIETRIECSLRFEEGGGVILDALLPSGEYYMYLGVRGAYARIQVEVSAVDRDRDTWVSRAIRNGAASGEFSSDRAVAGYARDIWAASSRSPVDGGGAGPGGGP